jgi:hypothetical protein
MLRDSRLKLSQLGRDIADGPRAVHHFGDGAAAGHLTDVLGEIADPQAPIRGDLALVRLLFACDHAEQRRLAGAIRADEADLLAFLERSRRFDEEYVPAVLFTDFSRRIMGPTESREMPGAPFGMRRPEESALLGTSRNRHTSKKSPIVVALSQTRT